MRPTFRNLTDSFESWAYRNGLHLQLQRLQKMQLIEARASTIDARIIRLTEAGRLLALGGRDPEACWAQSWDGFWRMALFDVPSIRDGERNKLRRYLRARGFGYLQRSVWITPHPISEENRLLAGSTIDVESLIWLESRPCAGESDSEIVSGAWDFDAINRSYRKHLEILDGRPRGIITDTSAAEVFLRWARAERKAWQDAVAFDPLLPAYLLPLNYLGRTAWCKRREALARAAEQIQAFQAVEANQTLMRSHQSLIGKGTGTGSLGTTVEESAD